jgi:hypothetical protein
MCDSFNLGKQCHFETALGVGRRRRRGRAPELRFALLFWNQAGTSGPRSGTAEKRKRVGYMCDGFKLERRARLSFAAPPPAAQPTATASLLDILTRCMPEIGIRIVQQKDSKRTRITHGTSHRAKKIVD